MRFSLTICFLCEHWTIRQLLRTSFCFFSTRLLFDWGATKFNWISFIKICHVPFLDNKNIRMFPISLRFLCMLLLIRGTIKSMRVRNSRIFFVSDKKVRDKCCKWNPINFVGQPFVEWQTEKKNYYFQSDDNCGHLICHCGKITWNTICWFWRYSVSLINSCVDSNVNSTSKQNVKQKRTKLKSLEVR